MSSNVFRGFSVPSLCALILVIGSSLKAMAIDEAAYDAAYAECTAKAEAAGDAYLTIFDECMSQKGFHATPVDDSAPLDDR